MVHNGVVVQWTNGEDEAHMRKARDVGVGAQQNPGIHGSEALELGERPELDRHQRAVSDKLSDFLHGRVEHQPTGRILVEGAGDEMQNPQLRARSDHALVDGRRRRAGQVPQQQRGERGEAIQRRGQAIDELEASKAGLAGLPADTTTGERVDRTKMCDRLRRLGNDLQILDTPGIDGVHDQAVDAGGGAEGEELERQPAARTPVAAGSEAPDGADHGAHGAALVPPDDGA